MASVDQVHSLHESISIFTGVGSALSLLGFSAYFTGYEYTDFDRNDAENRFQLNSKFQTRRKKAFVIFGLSASIFLAGLVLLTLGICLYRTERELIATSVAGIIEQKNAAKANATTTNEAAILASVASFLILLGSFECVRHFHKTENWGVVGAPIYGGGWLMAAFAAALNSNSINSLELSRLAWTLPGSVSVVAGTFLFPYALHHHYTASPALVLMSLGYAAFSIGTSLVLEGPAPLSQVTTEKLGNSL